MPQRVDVVTRHRCLRRFVLAWSGLMAALLGSGTGRGVPASTLRRGAGTTLARSCQHGVPVRRGHGVAAAGARLIGVPMSLPSGTVTFLFTDVEDSTRRWDDEPSAMGVALARHDVLLRQAVTAGRGVVFSHAGDGMAAVFGRGRDAIEAAVAAQRAFESEPWPVEFRVRMAVHTGEAEERDGDYFGPALNRAARLMGLASGGQVLVSLAAAEVVRDRLPDGSTWSSSVSVRCGPCHGPSRVFELTWTAGSRPIGVEVRVLGPLRLVVGGVDVVVPGPKRRALLALLAMAAPSPISVDSLVVGRVAGRRGGSGTVALQSHVSRLRRHLGAAASRLENLRGGYRLRL